MWQIVYSITDMLWGTPLLILIIGTGIYLSVRSGFFQLLGIRQIFRRLSGRKPEKYGRPQGKDRAAGTLGSFQALCTVLAGTVGSGNIAGVASAIAIGGPGAVFWMWLIAFFGLITKTAEVTLAVHFREKGKDGQYYGGPMLYMKKGIAVIGPVLAVIYACALTLDVLTDACFIQCNTLAVSAEEIFGIPLLVSGITVAVTAAFIVLQGGIPKIAELCTRMVPCMILLYLIGTAGVLLVYYRDIPRAFAMIFHDAFAPAAAVGGFHGAAVGTAIKKGASRGIFSNEAGMGTSAAVHAAARTDHPVSQGLYGIAEVLVDTFVVCSLTALTVTASGTWTSGEAGASMVFHAFSRVWGKAGSSILCIVIILFAFSSYIGFFVEFQTCLRFFMNEKKRKWIQWIFFVIPLLSVTVSSEKIWELADMSVGFVILPNLTALVILCPVFLRLVNDWKKKPKNREAFPV